MNEKMREEFEVWARRKHSHFLYPFNMVDGADRYVHSAVQSDWAVWKASRESLVIELPDDGIEDCQKEWPERGAKYEYDTFNTGYLYACMKHEQAIEDAGLKASR